MLGLEAKRSDSTRLLTTLGTFGIGLLVGAGVALLLAPKAGSELRENLRAKLRRADEQEGGAPKGSDGTQAADVSRSPA
jgi:gas vesicle protein